jgi:hypothetical protein
MAQEGEPNRPLSRNMTLNFQGNQIPGIESALNAKYGAQDSLNLHLSDQACLSYKKKTED